MKITGIRSKIILLLLGLITVVMLLITYLNVTFQVEKQMDAMTNQARAIARGFGLNYAESLLTNSPLDDKQKIITKLWKGSSGNAVFLIAYAANGKKIHQEPAELPTSVGVIPSMPTDFLKRLMRSELGTFRRWNQKDNLFDILVPIRYHQTNFGVVRLGINTSLIRKARNDIIVKNLQMLGLFWVVAALLGLISTARIIRPLESLVKVASSLGKGNLGARSDISTGDEIEELGNRFNEMAERIQERIKEREESLNQLQAIQKVGTLLNEAEDVETFFPILDQAVQTLYDMEEFHALIWDGEVFTTAYSRPEMDSPVYLSEDSPVIEQLDQDPEPFMVEPHEDWPEALQGVNLVYPLKVGYYLNGVLLMKIGHQLSDQEYNWMLIWGTQVAHAVRSMILNRQINEYRLNPTEAIRDTIQTELDSDYDNFARIDVPDFAEKQADEGLFYGEDFYETIEDSLADLDFETKLVQVQPDQFLLITADLSNFEKTDVEQAIKGLDIETFEVEWFEGEPTASAIHTFLIN